MVALAPLALFVLRWVRASKRGDGLAYSAGWYLFKGRKRWDGPISDKDRAVKLAAKRFRDHATAKLPVSLQIRTRDGRIEEERTYPRSRDPRRSKG